MTHHGWNLIGAGVKYQQINQYYFIDTGFAECTESNTQDTCVPCSNGFYLIPLGHCPQGIWYSSIQTHIHLYQSL
jgi:hypothetical protein